MPEIPLKPRQLHPVNGHQKSSSSGTSGTNKHRGETDKKKKEDAQRATQANKKVMVLDKGRKIRWYWASDWYSRPENQ